MGHAISRIDDPPEAIRHTKDGVPFDGIDFRIVDGDGNVLPAGQVGGNTSAVARRPSLATSGSPRSPPRR